jgi:hypothetical protein
MPKGGIATHPPSTFAFPKEVLPVPSSSPWAPVNPLHMKALLRAYHQSISVKSDDDADVDLGSGQSKSQSDSHMERSELFSFKALLCLQ